MIYKVILKAKTKREKKNDNNNFVFNSNYIIFDVFLVSPYITLVEICLSCLDVRQFWRKKKGFC